MQAIKAFLSSNTLKEFGDNVSQYLAQIFSAQGTVFCVLKDGKADFPGGMRSGICESGRINKLYDERFYQLDPLFVRPLVPYPYKVYITDDVVKDEDAFLKSEFYEGFLKQFSIRSHLVMNLGASRPKAMVIIARNGRVKRFDSSDKNLAHIVEPCLSAALERVFLLSNNLQHEFIINTLLEKVQAKGVVELDSSLQAVRANRSSETIISMLYEENEPRDTLPRLLHAALRERVSGMPFGGTITFEVKTPGLGQKVRVLATPTATNENAHLLLLLEFEHTSLFALRRLRQYGLSEREIEIVACIFNGMGNSEIADRLCISEYTVINHIRHIFEKTGVNSRIGLLHLVLDLIMK